MPGVSFAEVKGTVRYQHSIWCRMQSKHLTLLNQECNRISTILYNDCEFSWGKVLLKITEINSIQIFEEIIKLCQTNLAIPLWLGSSDGKSDQNSLDFKRNLVQILTDIWLTILCEDLPNYAISYLVGSVLCITCYTEDVWAPKYCSHSWPSKLFAFVFWNLIQVGEFPPSTKGMWRSRNMCLWTRHLSFCFSSCGIEVWEQRHEYQAIQLFSSSLLASKFHGCFHLVPALCWGERCVVESWDVLNKMV